MLCHDNLGDMSLTGDDNIQGPAVRKWRLFSFGKCASFPRLVYSAIRASCLAAVKRSSVELRVASCTSVGAASFSRLLQRQSRRRILCQPCRPNTRLCTVLQRGVWSHLTGLHMTSLPSPFARTMPWAVCEPRGHDSCRAHSVDRSLAMITTRLGVRWASSTWPTLGAASVWCLAANRGTSQHLSRVGSGTSAAVGPVVLGLGELTSSAEGDREGSRVEWSRLEQRRAERNMEAVDE
jgi:hypothetical protein